MPCFFHYEHIRHSQTWSADLRLGELIYGPMARSGPELKSWKFCTATSGLVDFRRYVRPGNGLRDFESPHRLSKRVEGLGVEVSSGQECGRTTAPFQLVHENLLLACRLPFRPSSRYTGGTGLLHLALVLPCLTRGAPGGTLKQVSKAGYGTKDRFFYAHVTRSPTLYCAYAFSMRTILCAEKLPKLLA